MVDSMFTWLKLGTHVTSGVAHVDFSLGIKFKVFRPTLHAIPAECSSRAWLFVSVFEVSMCLHFSVVTSNFVFYFPTGSTQ